MDLAWWVYQFGIINSFGEFIFLRCRTNYFLSRRARSPHSLLVGNSVGDFHAGASSTESVVYCVGTAERSLIQGLDPNVRGWKIGFCGKTFTTASLSQKNSKNFLARNDFLKLFTPKFFQWKPNGDSSLKRRLSSWCHCFGISLFYSIQRSRQPRAGPPIFLRISNCKRKHHFDQSTFGLKLRLSTWYFIIISPLRWPTSISRDFRPDTFRVTRSFSAGKREAFSLNEVFQFSISKIFRLILRRKLCVLIQN